MASAESDSKASGVAVEDSGASASVWSIEEEWEKRKEERGR
jgi:hypothetical protein